MGRVIRDRSCAPNLVNYEVLVESLDYQLAHIALFALRDVSRTMMWKHMKRGWEEEGLYSLMLW